MQLGATCVQICGHKFDPTQTQHYVLPCVLTKTQLLKHAAGCYTTEGRGDVSVGLSDQMCCFNKGRVRLEEVRLSGVILWLCGH